MSRIAAGPAAPYAPYGLDTDAATAGFVVTTVRGPIGTAVARHRATRTSTRATIFLHGAAGSWTTWTPLLAAADDSGVTIVNPVILDLPGWGDATPDPDSPALTIDIVSELVRDVALELGYTEWDLVGHSLGGFIALHMAAIWPQSVLSVSLVSGTTWSVIESVNHPRRGMRSIPGFVMLLGVMRVLAPIQPAALAVVRALRVLAVLRIASFPLFRHLSRVDRSVTDALSIELRPRSFVTAAEVARGYDADSSWGRIECEVRATMGDRDVFVTRGDLDRLERVVRRSSTRVIEDCGHFGHVERPLETLDALGYSAF
jgi:pimeloyl-ACP methyl ester carboxylesterase